MSILDNCYEMGFKKYIIYVGTRIVWFFKLGWMEESRFFFYNYYNGGVIIGVHKLFPLFPHYNNVHPPLISSHKAHEKSLCWFQIFLRNVNFLFRKRKTLSGFRSTKQRERINKANLYFVKRQENSIELKFGLQCSATCGGCFGAESWEGHIKGE